MSQNTHANLPLTARFAYGLGIWSIALPDTLLTIFFLYFLTGIAGLRPILAGAVLLIGRIWDAINDPLIGWLSDRTRTVWGRRYPWMVVGVLPLVACLGLLWWAPPITHQGFLFAYYSLVIVLYDLSMTAVVLPYATLAAELTEDYGDRTRLISFQSGFEIGGSILVLFLAQVVFAHIPNPAEQYRVSALLCGGLIIIAVGLCISGTYRYAQAARQPQRQPQAVSSPFWPQIKQIWADPIFRRLVGIYLCSLIALQVAGGMIPYFVITYMGQPETTVTTALLSAQFSSLAMVAVWGLLGSRLDKHRIYLMALPIWILANFLMLFLKPDQVGLLYGQMVLAGSGVAATYLLPWAMLPDVIDYQELRSGQRSEGMYYGFMVQLQKLGLALALFIVSLSLDWAGFVSTVAGQPATVKPQLAIQMIRWIMGLAPSTLLIGGLLLAYRYPITRQTHTATRLMLRERRESKIEI